MKFATEKTQIQQWAADLEDAMAQPHYWIEGHKETIDPDNLLMTEYDGDYHDYWHGEWDGQGQHFAMACLRATYPEIDDEMEKEIYDYWSQMIATGMSVISST